MRVDSPFLSNSVCYNSMYTRKDDSWNGLHVSTKSFYSFLPGLFKLFYYIQQTDFFFVLLGPIVSKAFSLNGG